MAGIACWKGLLEGPQVCVVSHLHSAASCVQVKSDSCVEDWMTFCDEIVTKDKKGFYLKLTFPMIVEHPVVFSPLKHFYHIIK